MSNHLPTSTKIWGTFSCVRVNNFSDINLLESLPPLRILDGAVSDWRYEGLHPAGVINIIELYRSRMLPISDSNILPFFIYHRWMLREMQIKIWITWNAIGCTENLASKLWEVRIRYEIVANRELHGELRVWRCLVITDIALWFDLRYSCTIITSVTNCHQLWWL